MRSQNKAALFKFDIVKKKIIIDLKHIPELDLKKIKYHFQKIVVNGLEDSDRQLVMLGRPQRTTRVCLLQSNHPF